METDEDLLLDLPPIGDICIGKRTSDTEDISFLFKIYPFDDFDSQEKDLNHQQQGKDPKHYNKGRWTEEENIALLKAYKRYQNYWNIISSHVKTRTARQCREHWKNVLDSRIIRAKWTKDEDKILLQKYCEYPNKWTSIQRFLPCRSISSIRARYKCLKLGKIPSECGSFITPQIPHQPNTYSRNRYSSYDVFNEQISFDIKSNSL